MTFRLYLTLIFLFLLGVVPFSLSAQSIRKILLNKVDSIPMPADDYISTFFTTNGRADVVAVTLPDGFLPAKSTAIVASTLGKGKVLALGGAAYLRLPMLADKNIEQLLGNALKWAGNGKTSLKVAVADAAVNPQLTAFLKTQHVTTYIAKKLALTPHTDVLILTTDIKDSLQSKKIEKFVTNGGTLIFGSPYSDIYRDITSKKGGPHSPNSYVALLMNDFLTKAGMFNIYQLQKRSRVNKSLAIDSIPNYLYLEKSLPLLLKPDSTDFDNALKNYFLKPQLEIALYANGVNSATIASIKKYFHVPDTLPTPTVLKPVHYTTAEEKNAAKIYYILYNKKQDFDEHPFAKAQGYETFPGDVLKNAQRVTKTVDIPVMVGRQGLPDMPSVYYRPHSTGLYVPAGEKVTIIITSKDLKEHLKAQIGVHDDDVTHLDEVRRLPVNMVKTFELSREKTEVYSPYGGLLLINIGDTSKLKNLTIKVQGAVEAPYFRLGKTTEQEWISTIRYNPAPWAELATDKIIFTVPSNYVRFLDNPEKLLKFWDEVMDADADLAIVSRKRVHQERIIVDVSVAAGALFTNPYKIVVPDEESSHQMLDEAYMRSNGLWGEFHELGHRHQFFDLDFPGTTEVTVNLFTMYVFEKVLHRDGLYQHEGMETKDQVIDRIKAYLNDNPTYEKWSNDPFLALAMYIQIIDAFGWDAIKAANTVYRNLPADQHPETDQDQRDLWFTTICRVTNSNMSRFFDVWKIAVSDKAKKQVQGYKEWFPEELAAYK